MTNGNSTILVQSLKLEPGFGEVGSGASQRNVKPTQTTTYTLTATGCGGTATKQVTVTVTKLVITPIPGFLLSDLEITDIYADQNWKAYVKIRNNGPSNLSNATATLSCTIGKSPTGGIPSAKGWSGPLTINLQIKQETSYSLNEVLYQVGYYDISCTVKAQSFSDSVGGNDSKTKKITRGP